MLQLLHVLRQVIGAWYQGLRSKLVAGLEAVLPPSNRNNSEGILRRRFYAQYAQCKLKCTKLTIQACGSFHAASRSSILRLVDAPVLDHNDHGLAEVRYEKSRVAHDQINRYLDVLVVVPLFACVAWVVVLYSPFLLSWNSGIAELWL
jgi:hypothetical protein